MGGEGVGEGELAAVHFGRVNWAENGLQPGSFGISVGLDRVGSQNAR